MGEREESRFEDLLYCSCTRVRRTTVPVYSTVDSTLHSTWAVVVVGTSKALISQQPMGSVWNFACIQWVFTDEKDVRGAASKAMSGFRWPFFF